MDYVTIKVDKGTRQQLRIIAAFTGEHMADVLARLCEAEVKRLIPVIPKGGAIVIHHHTSKSDVDDEIDEATLTIIDELDRLREEGERNK